MADEETTLSNERKEQIDPIAEIPEGFEEIVKGLDTGVKETMLEVEHTGDTEINSIERDGLAEEAEEMKKATKETTEEAKEAKEKYEEDLKNIPNFDDKIEAMEKEEEVRKETQGEYDEKLKDIPNPKDLAKSFRVEKNIEDPVVETEELPVEPKVKERKDGKLFDCLNEFNIGIEVINMEDTEAAIEKIDSILLDLALFSKENNQAILNNKELKTITKAVGQMLEIAKGMVMKNEAVYIELSDIALEASEIGQSEITASEKNNSLHNLSTKLGTVRTKMEGSGNKKLSDWFVGVENKVNGEIRRNQEAELTRLRESQVEESLDLKIKTKKNESEKPSVEWEVEDKSPVEYYQDTYDDIMKGIEEIINSDRNSYEKIDDLDREKEALKGRNDNFIPDDILKDEGVKEMIQDLKKEFDIARANIEESKTEEEKKSDAKKVVDFVVNNANKSLDFLKKSEETPSGKMSSLKGAMSLLESSTEKYKDIINSDEKLKGKLESTRSKINSALEEQGQLQDKNDELAAKYDV